MVPIRQHRVPHSYSGFLPSPTILDPRWVMPIRRGRSVYLGVFHPSQLRRPIPSIFILPFNQGAPGTIRENLCSPDRRAKIFLMNNEQNLVYMRLDD